MLRASVPLVVVVAVFLAGCSDGGPRSPASAADDPFGPAQVALGQSVLRFQGLDQAVDKTVWANGTVAVQDTCNTGGCILDTSRAYHRTDITADLPVGVPVEVTARLEYTPHPIFGGPVVFLEALDSVLYFDRTTIDYATGVGSVQAMIRASGDVAIVVAANAPGGELPATPYVLSIGIVAGPERVSPGAPIGVQLGPGSNLTFQAPGQTQPEFLLYAPDDALIGTVAGNITLPRTAARGEYVVMLPNGTQWGNLSSDAQTPMRALALAPEFGPEGTMAPSGPYQATWDVSGFPLAAGFVVHPAEVSSGIAPLASAGFEVAMEGANGVRVETGPLCGFCLTFGGLSWTFSTGTGNPAVIAQTYTFTGGTTAANDVRILPFALYLDRE